MSDQLSHDTGAPDGSSTRHGPDGQLLFGISLVCGLVLSWPSLHAAMHGDADIAAAGIRLLLAIAFAWAGLYAICKLLWSYAASVDQRPPLAALPAPGEAARRATDIVAVANTDEVSGQATSTASLPAP